MTGTQTRGRGDTTADLFTAFLDDAAIFPPGNAPMTAAVAAHRTWMESRWQTLVGPFVCSAPRWDELLPELAAGPPLPVSLTVPGGIDDLPAAVSRATAEPRVRLVSVEVPVSADELPTLGAQVSEHLSGHVRLYAELPWTQVAARQMKTLAHTGLRLKVRTGGTQASAFPDEVQLGRILWTSIRGGIPFKLTAGLHDAVRHRDPATGFEHHGYLNVVSATARALNGRNLASVVAALAEQEPTRVADEVAAIDASLAQRARRCFVGFGTCSISDPVTGLLELGLIQESTP